MKNGWMIVFLVLAMGLTQKVSAATFESYHCRLPRLMPDYAVNVNLVEIPNMASRSDLQVFQATVSEFSIIGRQVYHYRVVKKAPAPGRMGGATLFQSTDASTFLLTLRTDSAPVQGGRSASLVIRGPGSVDQELICK